MNGKIKNKSNIVNNFNKKATEFMKNIKKGQIMKKGLNN